MVLLGILAVTLGLGVTGWATGLTYGSFVCLALHHGLHTAGTAALGPANTVTLIRAGVVGGVAGLVAAGAFDPPVGIALATLALLLDAVDGAVARRTENVTPLGARFDMEVDAFLILVLSVHLAPVVGWWVLAIGLMRYALLVAGWLVPWLRRPVPPRYWRKVVAAIQGIVLVVVSAEVVPGWVARAALIGALALLVESFGRDLIWLTRQRLRHPVIMTSRS